MNLHVTKTNMFIIFYHYLHLWDCVVDFSINIEFADGRTYTGLHNTSITLNIVRLHVNE